MQFQDTSDLSLQNLRDPRTIHGHADVEEVLLQYLIESPGILTLKVSSGISIFNTHPREGEC